MHSSILLLTRNQGGSAKGGFIIYQHQFPLSCIHDVVIWWTKKSEDALEQYLETDVMEERDAADSAVGKKHLLI